MQLNWRGKPYRPLQAIKRYEPDINELMKPLSQKATKGTIFMVAQALNAKNEPSTPVPTATNVATPTPSPTPSSTPNPTNTPSPTESPTPSPTESPTPSPTNTSTPTQTPSPTPSATPSVDPDAQAFFNAITASGGTLNSTEESAINDLVVDLKTNNLWNKMVALYPVVSSGATVQSFNLKDPTQYNLTFYGSWNHNLTGAQPDGTSAYATTNVIPSVIDFVASGSIHYSMYITEDETAGCYDIGLFESGISGFEDWGLIASCGNTLAYVGGGDWYSLFNGGSTKKYWIGVVDATDSTIYYDGTQLGTNATGFAVYEPVIEFYISACNFFNSPGSYSGRAWALASIGLGLDSSEASTLYTIVQDYQTALSRQN